MKYVLIFLVVVSACRHESVQTSVIPRNFKIEFIYDLHGSAIMLPLSFGNSDKRYSLQFDNHSPSWVNGHIIKQTDFLKKINYTQFKTSAADGTEIEGDVY